VRLPLCDLPPSKLAPNLCLLRYKISTASPECQAFFDQGLGYFYSYVWMEASRSFETAVRCDPECPMAWWGLSRALERYGRRDQATEALLRAHALRDNASHREQQLILASMQEKGQAPGVGDAEARRKAAIGTLDNMLAVYEDDEEAWYFRAQLAGGSGLFGGQVSAVPFYKSLLRVNPLHPGANHELLHFYENYKRPALGLVHAENYIRSSPGIPHPFHMQAHLATRLGRWRLTSDRSARAIELEKAYHKELNVKPSDDQQYSHHLEILLVSLTHDGRFAEARGIEADMRAAGHKTWLPWGRLHLAARDWPGALKIANECRKTDKGLASYLAALTYLKQGDAGRALPEIEVLQEAARRPAHGRAERQAEFRLWEAQGLYLCQTGSPDAGLKLLQRAVDKTKDDYSHHAWGNGAYYMEAWGAAALQAGRTSVAEEAFLEALAHDSGSVRAALGLQVLCEREGRSEEAGRYAALARRCWGRAEPDAFRAELDACRLGTARTAALGR
jgi:tetratricopeptide (TPR) repeat protein